MCFLICCNRPINVRDGYGRERLSVEEKKLVPREIENCLIGRWTYITNKLLRQTLNDGAAVVSLVLSLCVYVT